MGTWEGKFLSQVDGLGEADLVVEIYNFKDSMFTGLTHLYYRGNYYEHYKMIGWYDKKEGLLVFRESSTIAVDLGVFGNCLGTYQMKLRKEGNNLYQDGRWVANIKRCSPTTMVWLQKRPEEIKVEPVPEKEPVVIKKAPVKAPPEVKPVKEKPAPVVITPPVAPPAKDVPVVKTIPAAPPVKITERETDVQSLLEIAPSEKDSIRVDVYDNGEIDGDSVSVYEEHVLRINKKMITAKPITFYVSLNKNVNPIVHLRLVAENLGTIPPCTALMIVTTRLKRYEVRLSSNFSRNATVELFLKNE